MNRFLRFLREYNQLSLAIAATLAAFILELSHLPTAAHWTLGVTASLLVLPILWSMWQDIQSGKYGIDILAATAIISSVLLRQDWAAIIIVVMLTGGEALEDYAGHRAKTELDALLTRAPRRATIIRKGKELDVPVNEIRLHDLVILKPGDVVPVDAVITEGIADFDESGLTGESIPQPKGIGEEILSGSINTNSAITAKCIRIAADSQYEQIIKLVRSAANSQAPVVRLADRYSIPFTIISYIIAITAWILGHHAIRFLEVIVVATPCPLLLAAPIAVISGMSRAAKHGIIIKTGSALEQLAEANTIAFDKTGTLTLGEPQVDSIVAYSPFKKQEVLSFAASLEQASNHVLAKAIVEKARNTKIPKAKHVKEFAGLGMAARISSHDVLVGRLSFLQSHDIDITKLKSSSAQLTTFVSVDGVLAGSITFKDTVRDESKRTIKALLGMGIKDILMLTGDNLESAKAIAKQVGIKKVKAHMLPGDKLQAIEAITDRPVAFVGDGVNDAPVLMASDIGIALGARGSTAASESADMVIMLDDLTRVTKAVDIAKHTFAIAKQSILGGILLSIILMFIFATGHFQPVVGAILQECVDVLVIFNALRAHSSK